MNAVSLNAPNQISPALSPAALSKGVALSQGPTAGGGFIDLISLLLARVSTDAEPSAATPASSSDAVSTNDAASSSGDVPANLLVSPQLVPYKGVLYKGQFTNTSASLSNVLSPAITSASPDQIASALIRFMAKGEGPGTPVGSPPTGAGKKASPDQRSADTSKTIALPLFPANQAATGLVAPQPAVVSIDPQTAAKTISIPGAAETKTEMADRPVINGPVFNGPAINGPVINGPAGLAPPPPSLLDPSSPNLKLTGPASAATAPVTFKMQLTPVTSQDPDSPATPDPQFTPVTQTSATSAIPSSIPPAAASTTEIQTPASSGSDPASSAVIAAVSGSPTVLKGPASNVGENPDETGQGTLSVAATAVTADPSKRSEKSCTETKSGSDTKSGTEPNTADDPAEKTPMAAAPSAPATNQIQAALFPALHTPAPPPPAQPHAASAGPKVSDQPAALPATDTKDVLAASPPSSGQTQQIDVRVTQSQAPPVDLQVAQRSGQIQVVVRTSDAGLESALRQDLGTLVHSLERSGFQAETFVPNASDSSQTNSHADAQHKHPDSSANGPFNQGSAEGGRQGGGQNQGRNGGRGSGGNSRGNAFRDPRQFEAWTNLQEQQP